ncbi:MAG: c-type cytochrome domain-containing protein, partial [Verrucomicrobiia bacterium]
MRRLFTGLVAMVAPVIFAATPTELEFFEKKIRPVLVSECFKCHSKGKKIKGELRLDWRGGWQKGGESGAAIIPGRVGKSLLIQAIRHADADL